jgi:hypothetical protein
MPRSYIATVYALPEKTLLGGIKEVTSLPFASEQDAKDYLWAMTDQKNADKERSNVQPSDKKPLL